jgi:hypothetical protein
MAYELDQHVSDVAVELKRLVDRIDEHGGSWSAGRRARRQEI